MVQCKHCGYPLSLLNKRKSWTMKGAHNIKTKIDLYDCPKCKKQTRIGTRLE